jgi:hypothetical protein
MIVKVGGKARAGRGGAITQGGASWRPLFFLDLAADVLHDFFDIDYLGGWLGFVHV